MVGLLRQEVNGLETQDVRQVVSWADIEGDALGKRVEGRLGVGHRLEQLVHANRNEHLGTIGIGKTQTLIVVDYTSSAVIADQVLGFTRYADSSILHPAVGNGNSRVDSPLADTPTDAVSSGTSHTSVGVGSVSQTEGNADGWALVVPQIKPSQASLTTSVDHQIAIENAARHTKSVGKDESNGANGASVQVESISCAGSYVLGGAS